jgi:hypothetical protein
MVEGIVFIDHVDTDTGWDKSGKLEVCQFNCLVFNISDDNLHNE